MKHLCLFISILYFSLLGGNRALYGQKTPFNKPITNFLTRTKQQTFPSQKALAYHIFEWVSGRTRYNRKLNYSDMFKSNFSYKNLEEKIAKEWDLNIQLANYTAQHREAVCHGYATLFYVLAQELGLSAKILVGFAHNDIIKIGKKQKSNHAWIEVLIEDNWEHIDPTWAAGYFDITTGEFKQDLEKAYFLMPREYVELIYEPLDEPESMTDEKLAKPVYYRGFLKNNLKLINDFEGIIPPYTFLQLRLENVPENKNLYLLNNNQQRKLRRIGTKPNTFEIPRLQRGSLMIFLEHQLILGFKIR